MKRILVCLLLLGVSGRADADGKKGNKKAEKATAGAPARPDAYKDLDARCKGSASFGLGGRQVGGAPDSDVDEVEQVQGARLSSQAVEHVISAHMGELRFCYERQVISAKAPSEVTLRFVVDPRGKASGVAAVGLSKDARAFERCLVKAVKRWSFPAADLETEVEYPVLFGAGGDDENVQASR